MQPMRLGHAIGVSVEDDRVNGRRGWASCGQLWEQTVDADR